MSMPNPCDSCTKTSCDHRRCALWLNHLRTTWKQFNSYARKVSVPKPATTRQVFRYEHPDIIRRYLQNGPCAECKASEVCDIPCGAYWRWWDARMEWLRGLLSRTGETV